MNDFIEELRDVCKQQSQRVVAEKMGYSHTTISLVLNGKYAGNLKTVEKAFNGAFKSAAVICPILGAIPAHRCLSIQRQPFAATNHQRVLLFKACKACAHKIGQDNVVRLRASDDERNNDDDPTAA